MKKKAVIVLLILIPILTAIVIYLINTQNAPVFKEQSGDIVQTDEEDSVPNSVSVTPTTTIVPATINELLTELESGKRAAEDERIIPLINEESALGYYSNLVLANRYEREGKDASEHYYAALSLYYT